MDQSHARYQIPRNILDRVGRLTAGLDVSKLGNRPAAEDAEALEGRFFLHLEPYDVTTAVTRGQGARFPRIPFGGRLVSEE